MLRFARPALVAILFSSAFVVAPVEPIVTNVQASEPQFFNPTPTPGKRNHFSLTWHNGQMWLAFGWDGSWDYSDLWRTANGDPRGEWKRIKGQNSAGDMTAWLERSYVMGTSFNGAIHWPGGYRAASAPAKVIDQHVSTVAGHNIQVHNSQYGSWEAREAQGVAVLNNRMFMVGGVTYLNPDAGASLRAFDDVWAFDTDERWSLALSNAPWGKLRSMGVQPLGGVLHIWGGWNSQNVLQQVHYTWDGVNAPIQLPTPPWAANGSFYHFVLGGRLWMVGGNNGWQHDQVWSWDSTNGWVQHAAFPGGALVGMQAAVAPASGSNPDEAFIIYPATNQAQNTSGYPAGWQIRAEVWGAKFSGGTLVWTRYPASTLDTAP